eukprot:scaffold214481_cov20-Tisochrysis_lutea.AAC.1
MCIHSSSGCMLPGHCSQTTFCGCTLQLLDHLEVDINEAKKAELFARFDPDNSKVITFVEFEAAYGHLQVCSCGGVWNRNRRRGAENVSKG